MGVNIVALLWGFAEATLFFIVPDVLLTAIAVRRGRQPALRAIVWTIAGAVVGGWLMFNWAAVDHAAAVATLDRLPAISQTMISDVRGALDRLGAGAMALGALSGVPYKIYATMAPAAGLSLPTFLALSIPARAIRFVLVVWIADWLNRRLARRFDLRWRSGVLAAVWLFFYALYFSLMPR